MSRAMAFPHQVLITLDLRAAFSNSLVLAVASSLGFFAAEGVWPSPAFPLGLLYVFSCSLNTCLPSASRAGAQHCPRRQRPASQIKSPTSWNPHNRVGVDHTEVNQAMAPFQIMKKKTDCVLGWWLL